jgi:hypothetical protein
MFGCPLCANSGHWSPSLDHLVGAAEQQWWHFEVQRLAGLEIDDQLEFGRPLDW